MKSLKFAATGLALAALIAAGTASAQAPVVAKIKGLTGTVLVSQGDAMVAGANDQPLRIGTRVVTTSGASVIVSYERGNNPPCEIKLAENQRFVVREFSSCGALIAAIEGTGIGAGAGAGAAGAGFAAGLGATGGVALVAGVAIVGAATYDAIRQSNNDTNPSP